MKSSAESVKCLGVLLTVLLLASEAFSSEQLTIVYTNSLNGYLDYCHCASDPKGGLVKRATEFRSIKSQYRNGLYLDTGDTLTYDPDPIGAAYLMRAMKYLGYDAMAPGDQEFSLGAESFMAMVKEMPFLCSNLQLNLKGNWSAPLPDYRIVERGAIKTALIATIHKDSFRYYPAGVTSKVKVLDQARELKKVISEIKRHGADFVILLSHSGYERDVEIAGEFSEIDVIVGGHSQTLLKEPVKKGGAVIVQAGSNGAHIGILELAVDRGKVVSFKNSFRRPDEFQPADDPHVRGLINEYKNRLKKETGSLRFK